MKKIVSLLLLTMFFAVPPQLHAQKVLQKEIDTTRIFPRVTIVLQYPDGSIEDRSDAETTLYGYLPFFLSIIMTVWTLLCFSAVWIYKRQKMDYWIYISCSIFYSVLAYLIAFVVHYYAFTSTLTSFSFFEFWYGFYKTIIFCILMNAGITFFVLWLGNIMTRARQRSIVC